MTENQIQEINSIQHEVLQTEEFIGGIADPEPDTVDESVVAAEEEIGTIEDVLSDKTPLSAKKEASEDTPVISYDKKEALYTLLNIETKHRMLRPDCGENADPKNDDNWLFLNDIKVAHKIIEGHQKLIDIRNENSSKKLKLKNPWVIETRFFAPVDDPWTQAEKDKVLKGVQS